jgi:hypothetical protein
MMQGPASNPNGDDREMGDSGFNFNRLMKEGDILYQKDVFQSRIDSADLKELVSILRELFEHKRTQLGQYGLEGFNDSLRNRDLGRVRSTIPRPTEAARPPGEHFTPREFEALLQGFLRKASSELESIRGLATQVNNSVYGLARMTKRIEHFEREIPDDYFSDVSPEDLIKLANFYSSKSPEAPVLFEEMVAYVVSANNEKDRLMMVGALGSMGQSDPFESVRRQIAAIQEKGDSEDFLEAAAIALKISIDGLDSVRRLRAGALLADEDTP